MGSRSLLATMSLLVIFLTQSMGIVEGVTRHLIQHQPKEYFQLPPYTSNQQQQQQQPSSKHEADIKSPGRLFPSLPYLGTNLKEEPKPYYKHLDNNHHHHHHHHHYHFSHQLHYLNHTSHHHHHHHQNVHHLGHHVNQIHHGDTHYCQQSHHHKHRLQSHYKLIQGHHSLPQHRHGYHDVSFHQETREDEPNDDDDDEDDETKISQLLSLPSMSSMRPSQKDTPHNNKHKDTYYYHERREHSGTEADADDDWPQKREKEEGVFFRVSREERNGTRRIMAVRERGGGGGKTRVKGDTWDNDRGGGGGGGRVSCMQDQSTRTSNKQQLQKHQKVLIPHHHLFVAGAGVHNGSVYHTSEPNPHQPSKVDVGELLLPRDPATNNINVVGSPPGPSFDGTLPRNITMQAGQTAVLSCRVFNVNDKSVSWMRQENLHILTVDKYKYSTDQRVSVLFNEPNLEWVLRIRGVTPEDAGPYECQVSTKPVLSFVVNVTVVVPRAWVVNAPEMHVHRGSPINLTCVVSHGTQLPVFIYWYHHDKVLDYNGREGVRVETLTGRDTVSHLLVEKADLGDAGRYTCAPSNGIEASVNLHVLDGEYQAATQTNSGSTLWPRRRTPSWTPSLPFSPPLLVFLSSHNVMRIVHHVYS